MVAGFVDTLEQAILDFGLFDASTAGNLRVWAGSLVTKLGDPLDSY